MHDGNQVIRFDNKYKSSDLGGLSVELTSRKGTGNYDKDRSKFNIEYQTINGNLASMTYEKLAKNNITYGTNKKNINLINGVIVTSGPEFFQSLGMKFKQTDRFYQVGDKKGLPILVPDITNKNDIPKRVIEYFNESYNFLSEFVGKDNIIYSAIHFDEDTPHMHFYFIPVVNEVKRKVFKKDTNNNTIKKEITDKNGNKKYVPIQSKDSNGNNIYKIEKGNFLNSDQFWKNKGGNNSFAKVQNDYNEFILSKGFNLSRGEIGSNKEHTNKLEHEYNELKSKCEQVKNEYTTTLSINNIELEKIKKLTLTNNDIVLSRRKIIGYKESDVNNLINTSTNISRENELNKIELNKQNILINALKSEIKEYKSGKLLTEKDILISNQKGLIADQNKLISELKQNITELKYTINMIKKDMLTKLNNAYKAVKHLLKINDKDFDHKDCERMVNKVNLKFKKDLEK